MEVRKKGWQKLLLAIFVRMIHWMDMTALWISFAALYALGMLWLAYQIRTAPSDLELGGEEIE